MTSGPQLFRVDPNTRASDKIAEVDFQDLGLHERRDIQEWIADNPGILGDDLLIIGKEFSGFDRTNERIDLLAVDTSGKLVVIELKRDDSGEDAHWQAIKYASYLDGAGADVIVGMLAKYSGVSQDVAQERLIEHIESDNLDVLNNDQRIILASHRFAAEVTSAVLWLNEKAPGEDLITCIQLTPHRDPSTKSLYVQANTIIPVPGIDDFLVGIGELTPGRRNVYRARYSQRKENESDEVTTIFKNVAELTKKGLSDELLPDRESQHAGGWGGNELNFRYFRLWYSAAPWGNDSMCYRVNLMVPKSNFPLPPGEPIPVDVGFQFLKSGKNAIFSQDEVNDLENRLAGLHILDGQTTNMRGRSYGGISVTISGDSLNDKFVSTLAETLTRFIQEITPVIGEFENERNPEDV